MSLFRLRKVNSAGLGEECSFYRELIAENPSCSSLYMVLGRRLAAENMPSKFSRSHQKEYYEFNFFLTKNMSDLVKRTLQKVLVEATSEDEKLANIEEFIAAIIAEPFLSNLNGPIDSKKPIKIQKHLFRLAYREGCYELVPESDKFKSPPELYSILYCLCNPFYALDYSHIPYRSEVGILPSVFKRLLKFKNQKPLKASERLSDFEFKKLHFSIREYEKEKSFLKTKCSIFS